jgi:hypothetical protein
LSYITAARQIVGAAARSKANPQATVAKRFFIGKVLRVVGWTGGDRMEAKPRFVPQAFRRRVISNRRRAIHTPGHTPTRKRDESGMGRDESGATRGIRCHCPLPSDSSTSIEEADARLLQAHNPPAMQRR